MSRWSGEVSFSLGAGNSDVFGLDFANLLLPKNTL